MNKMTRVSICTPAVSLLLLALRGDSFTPNSHASRRNYGPPLARTRLVRQIGFPLRMAATISKKEELIPGIETIDKSVDEIFEKLENLREKAYFRYFSVDILGSCEYMPQEMFECYTESCEIYPEDDDEIPDTIRQADMGEHHLELDGWARWDMPSNDYYDTQAFPEGYTGYDGREVWDFIHDRICFTDYKSDDDHWKADFNKAVSGVHSIISAQVVRGIRDKIDDGEDFEDDEKWRDPVAEFNRRLSVDGETPLALENMYFVFMLLLSATSKAKDRLLADCKSGKIGKDAAEDLKAILEMPLLSDASISAASQKFQKRAVASSDSSDGLWQARLASRDLVRIMNCVQCNKCRFHGKISFLGLSAAFQILLGPEGKGGDIDRVQRVELAALVTTLHKCSTAIKFCQEMQ